MSSWRWPGQVRLPPRVLEMESNMLGTWRQQQQQEQQATAAVVGLAVSDGDIHSCLVLSTAWNTHIYLLKTWKPTPVLPLLLPLMRMQKCYTCGSGM